MKRDMNFFRAIMLHFESMQSFERINIIQQGQLDNINSKIEGKHSMEQYKLHVNMLADTNLIEISELQQGYIVIDKITSKGYDFIATFKDDRIWNAVNERLREITGGTASIEIMQEIAKKIILERI